MAKSHFYFTGLVFTVGSSDGTTLYPLRRPQSADSAAQYRSTANSVAVKATWLARQKEFESYADQLGVVERRVETVKKGKSKRRVEHFGVRMLEGNILAKKVLPFQLSQLTGETDIVGAPRNGELVSVVLDDHKVHTVERLTKLVKEAEKRFNSQIDELIHSDAEQDPDTVLFNKLAEYATEKGVQICQITHDGKKITKLLVENLDCEPVDGQPFMEDLNAILGLSSK